MTENVFMTDEAWLQIPQVKVPAGIHSMPYIKENPGWWVLKVVNGFGSHIHVFHALKIRQDAKILVLKEEGDSSHVDKKNKGIGSRETRDCVPGSSLGSSLAIFIYGDCGSSYKSY
jgi:hypothetical protein